MKTDVKLIRKGLGDALLLLALILLSYMAQGASAQNVPKKKVGLKAVYSSLPQGYTQVGTTQLCAHRYSTAIDMLGYFGGQYYSSTYSNVGYSLAVKVDNNSAVDVDCLNGTTTNGVMVTADVQQQGDLARIIYNVTNCNSSDVLVSIGNYADVMIGNNDYAPIVRRIDTFGQTYGLTMLDGNGAQLCVLFGSGLAGVTAVNDFWFGRYSTNNSAWAMVGNYGEGSNYMQENGSYDSGMGWCWKDRSIAAGETVTFSYLIGVGEVNLEPNSSFEVTPDDPEGWNDLSKPHVLTFNGAYESPAGLDGVIDYAVEDSEEWMALTDTLASGDEFTATVIATFDPAQPVHRIRFRTKDAVGNTSLLQPIEYADVSFHELQGIADLTYTGDSLYQAAATCDLADGDYVLRTYRNNVNVGVASFNIEGVFPRTIGRKTYSFAINPQPLSGEILLPTDTTFTYCGLSICPEWKFSNADYSTLEPNNDYLVEWTDNILPGTATLTVKGLNNYTGALTAQFVIDKAPLTAELYSLSLPPADITFDGLPHAASVTTAQGVGKATLSYMLSGATTASTEPPVEAGTYKIILDIAEGELYHAAAPMEVGEFTIYRLGAEEWATLVAVTSQLTKMGWIEPWDLSQGINSVSAIERISIEHGHIVGLNLSQQGLTGLFPYSVLALPYLRNLNLSGNNLSGDIGLTAYAFAQQNPQLTFSLSEVNMQSNALSGNIGIFAACFANLTVLDASHNCIEDVYPMIAPTVTQLDLSCQTISRVVPLHLANLSVDSIATKVPSVLLYDHANQTYSPLINMLCTSRTNDWGIILSYADGNFGVSYYSQNNIYRGSHADTLNVAVLRDDLITPEGSSFSLLLDFDDGDCNFDGKVNVLDVQTDVLYIMESYNRLPFNFTAANLWTADDIINVQDVVTEVNLLLLTPPAADVPAQAPATAFRLAPAVGEAALGVQNGVLVIDSDIPVAAFDITLMETDRFVLDHSLEQAGIMVASRAIPGGLRIIGYSLGCATVPAGVVALGSVGGNAHLGSVMLSDAQAAAIAVSDTSRPLGVDDIEIESDEENTSTFDLLGRPMTKPAAKGIYIVNGRKVVK